MNVSGHRSSNPQHDCRRYHTSAQAGRKPQPLVAGISRQPTAKACLKQNHSVSDGHSGRPNFRAGRFGLLRMRQLLQNLNCGTVPNTGSASLLHADFERTQLCKARQKLFRKIHQKTGQAL
jgi:hypothetical protein